MVTESVSYETVLRDAKSRVIGELGASIFFEKRASASSVGSGRPRKFVLALPDPFLAKHGDKTGKSVLLRSRPSTKAWTVNLTSFTGDQRTQVRFAGGWKEFAAFNGLCQGDFLIFSMTAISEFVVYVFQPNGSMKPFPSRPPKKRSNGFEIARKQAKKHHQCRDDLVSISRSSSAIVLSSPSSNGIDSHPSESEHNQEKDSSSSSKARRDSRRSHEPASCHCHERHSNRASCPETSLTIKSDTAPHTNTRMKKNYDQDYELQTNKFAQAGTSTGPRTGHRDSRHSHEPESFRGIRFSSMASGLGDPAFNTRARTTNDNENSQAKTPTTRNSSQFPGFSTKLTVGNFFWSKKTSTRNQNSARLEIPPEFWKRHISRISSPLQLQGVLEESPVRTVRCSLISQYENQYWRLFMRAGWTEFASENNLRVGQELEFTLAADSFFVVRKKVGH